MKLIAGLLKRQTNLTHLQLHAPRKKETLQMNKIRNEKGEYKGSQEFTLKNYTGIKWTI